MAVRSGVAHLPAAREPPLTRHAAMVMARDCTLKGGKARRELGYVPRLSVEEGLRRLSASLGTAAR